VDQIFSGGVGNRKCRCIRPPPTRGR
jgi:hypothetical protein